MHLHFFNNPTYEQGPVIDHGVLLLPPRSPRWRTFVAHGASTTTRLHGPRLVVLHLRLGHRWPQPHRRVCPGEPHGEQLQGAETLRHAGEPTVQLRQRHRRAHLLGLRRRQALQQRHHHQSPHRSPPRRKDDEPHPSNHEFTVYTFIISFFSI